MKKLLLLSALCIGLAAPVVSYAQEDAPAPAATENAIVPTDGAAPAPKKTGVFYDVVFGSGWLGTVLWIALFSTIGIYIWLLIDCSLTISTKKIIPQHLIDAVEQAMKDGDVVKALECCSNEPGPMANILTAGFNHVEEGYDVIQEAITTAADLEVEKIQQRLGWFSVDGNIAPMLGLLGTVWGVLDAFADMGAAGSATIATMAPAISSALVTTVVGLLIAIPGVALHSNLSSKLRDLMSDLEGFADDLMGRIALEFQGRSA